MSDAADRYGGVIVDDATLPDTVDAFAAQLGVHRVDRRRRQGVWLKIPRTRGTWARLCAAVRIPPRRARLRDDDRWLPADEPDMLPPNASHRLGSGRSSAREGEGAAGAGRRVPRRRRRGRTFGSADRAGGAGRTSRRRQFARWRRRGQDGLPPSSASSTGTTSRSGRATCSSSSARAARRREDASAIRILRTGTGGRAGGHRGHGGAQPASCPGRTWTMYGLCVEHAAGRYAGMGWQALLIGFNRDGTVTTCCNARRGDLWGRTRVRDVLAPSRSVACCVRNVIRYCFRACPAGANRRRSGG